MLDMINAQSLSNPYITPLAQEHSSLQLQASVRKGYAKVKSSSTRGRAPYSNASNGSFPPKSHQVPNRRVVSWCYVIVVVAVVFVCSPISLYPFRNSDIAESSKLIDEACQDTFLVPGTKADMCLQIDVLHMLSRMSSVVRSRYDDRSNISCAIAQIDSAFEYVQQNAYTDIHSYTARHRGIDMMPKISHRRTSH